MSQWAKKNSAHATALMAAPMVSPLKAFWPLWRFGSNVRSATDGDLDGLSDAAVIAEWCCAAMVVLGVAAEFVIAARHPLPDSWLGWWGPAYADLLVAIGVAGEVLASMIAHACQGELTRRSNAQLEKANKELAELHVRLAPRRIPQAAEEAMVVALKEFSGTLFRGAVISGGNDTRVLWVDIWRTLTSAGWVNAKFPRDQKFGTGAPWEHDAVFSAYNGVFVGVPQQFFNDDRAGKALAAVLNEAGIYAVAGIQGGQTVSKIVTITVGPKPP